MTKINITKEQDILIKRYIKKEIDNVPMKHMEICDVMEDGVNIRVEYAVYSCMADEVYIPREVIEGKQVGLTLAQKRNIREWISANLQVNIRKVELENYDEKTGIASYVVNHGWDKIGGYNIIKGTMKIEGFVLRHKVATKFIMANTEM